jgi:hypothetical protein
LGLEEMNLEGRLGRLDRLGRLEMLLVGRLLLGNLGILVDRLK